jgi:nanoRNase/pAp phosphatase (c-di-AMP/oligoRNAs hydrolase)
MESQTRKNICLITGHEAADFDVFGSLIAANALFQVYTPNERISLLWPGTMDSRMQKIVKILSVTPGTVPFCYVKKLINETEDRPVDLIYSLNQLDLDSITKLVVVDTKSPQRLKHIQVSFCICVH